MTKHTSSVTADWLAQNLNNPDVLILDCHCNVEKVFDDAPLYPKRHIPEAIFCSIDDISDQNASLPHTLPPAEKMNAFVHKNGIHAKSHVVCYSFGKLFAAPRIWWIFRVFGHEHVSVLDASLKQWQAKGLPLTNLPTTAVPVPTDKPPFQATLQPHLLANTQQIKNNTSQTIVDARSPVRFHGTAPEPRNIPSGHIPGAVNLPFTELLKADGTLRPSEQLKKAFLKRQIDPDTPFIFSCGSGITACILAWGQAQIGSDKSAVYDGSWSEWASDPENPVAT